MKLENLDNINITNLTETLESFLKENNLNDIIEYVYSYKKTEQWYINKTLFNDFLNLQKEELDKIPKEELLKLIHDKLDSIIAILKQLKEKFKLTHQPKNLEEFRKYIASNYIDYAIKMLTLTRYGALFEIEKLWPTYKFPENQRKEYLTKLQNIEKQIFWPLIKENPEELQKIYIYLNQLLQNPAQEIDESEKQIVNKVLKYIKNRSWFKPTWTIKQKFNFESFNLPNKKLDAKDLVDIFNLVFKIYWINKIAKLDPTKSTIYDSKEWLIVPEKRKFSIEETLRLITHEIETHYITMKNTFEKIKSPFDWNYLPKEESLAKIFETFAINDEITEIWTFFPLILWTEILNTNELKLFISTIYKLTGKIQASPENIEKRLLRLKRNYPFDLLWWQHKDVTYTRGIASILNDSNKLKFFWWRFSFNSVNLLEKILKQNNPIERSYWKYLNFFTYPYLIWEILKWKLSWKKLDKNFFDYIKEKYSFIPQIITLQKINKLNRKQKEQLVKILRKLK